MSYAYLFKYIIIGDTGIYYNPIAFIICLLLFMCTGMSFYCRYILGPKRPLLIECDQSFMRCFDTVRSLSFRCRQVMSLAAVYR